MRCSDLQLNLPLYGDDIADEAIALHLESCPVCRQQNSDLTEIRVELRKMARPEMPASLATSIKRSVRSEILKETNSWIPVAPDVMEWLQMRVMPFGVGVFASVAIGITFLTMLFSGIAEPIPFSMAEATKYGDRSVLLASNTDPFQDIMTDDISAASIARSRTEFANESPSVNPKGALVALTRSLIRGGMRDDEVVVVADVFGNGLAHIAEVVEPSRDRRAVSELQKALESNPEYAAFVPTELEDRAESVRVILKLQSVDVYTDPPRKRRR
jgi:hypothetical protein